MANTTQYSLYYQIRTFKNSILQLQNLPFSEVLNSDILRQIIEDSAHRRDRIFTPLVTLSAFIYQVLSIDGSCRQAVSHILSDRLHQGHEAISIKTGAYCKARNRLPLKRLKQAVESSGRELHTHAHKAWLWKGHHTLLVDGTTVSMPDTLKNQQSFPQQSCQKQGLGFPIARIVGLTSLSVGTVTAYCLGAFQGKGSGETSLFSQLISSISKDELLLADRYYCTWAIIALLQQQGSHFLVQNHVQRKPDFRMGKKLGKKDHLVEWKKPKRKPEWITAADYNALPEIIIIREVRVKGRVYVTTLNDERKYPKKELAEFYTQRWKIELDFRSLKTQMKMDMLRCKSPEMVEKEIAVNLLAYNLIRANIARAVQAEGGLPRQVSFMTAAQLFNQRSSTTFALTKKALKHVIDGVFKAIVSIAIGQQKRLKQPRAIKRRPKSYPLLTVPRKDACEAINL